MDSTHFDEAVKRLRVEGRGLIQTEAEARVVAAVRIMRPWPTDAELAEVLADDDKGHLPRCS
jgi:hypothetical protein